MIYTPSEEAKRNMDNLDNEKIFEVAGLDFKMFKVRHWWNRKDATIIWIQYNIEEIWKYEGPELIPPVHSNFSHDSWMMQLRALFHMPKRAIKYHHNSITTSKEAIMRLKKQSKYPKSSLQEVGWLPCRKCPFRRTYQNEDATRRSFHSKSSKIYNIENVLG